MLKGNDQQQLLTVLRRENEQRGTSPTEPPYRTPVTEIANADRFLSRYHAEVRYLADRGIWTVFNGKFWVLNDFGGVMRRMAETAREIYFEAGNEPDENRRKALANWAKASESRRVQENSVDLARHDLRIEIRRFSELFDKKPLLLNVPNGTIDLRTGKLLAHRREDFLTVMAPLAYDVEATCPKFQKFLADTLPSNGLVGYVTRFLGYALTGLTWEQAWFLFHGATASGKSTLLNILRGILGPYALTLPENYFLITKNTSDFATANLAGIRLAVCVESNEGKRLDVARIKHITGGDSISAALKYQNFFEFTPEAKLVLATNHAPRVPESDDAIWRRIKVIPFVRTVPEPERIPDLAQRLIDAEGPGILRLAVLACQAWQADTLGRNEPEVLRSAVKEYRSEEDVVASFYSERCTVEEGARTSRSDAYRAFFDWSKANGIRAMSAKRFAAELQRLGVEKHWADESRFWAGFRV